MKNRKKTLLKACQALINYIDTWDMEFENEIKIINDIKTAIASKKINCLLTASQALIDYINPNNIDDERERKFIFNIRKATKKARQKA